MVFKRANLTHVLGSLTLVPTWTDILVSYTGLSSLTLLGVEDKNLYPTRGQIALVRNESGGTFSVSGTDDNAGN